MGDSDRDSDSGSSRSNNDEPVATAKLFRCKLCQGKQFTADQKDAHRLFHRIKKIVRPGANKQVEKKDPAHSSKNIPTQSRPRAPPPPKFVRPQGSATTIFARLETSGATQGAGRVRKGKPNRKASESDDSDDESSSQMFQCKLCGKMLTKEQKSEHRQYHSRKSGKNQGQRESHSSTTAVSPPQSVASTLGVESESFDRAEGSEVTEVTLFSPLRTTPNVDSESERPPKKKPRVPTEPKTPRLRIISKKNYDETVRRTRYSGN